MVWSMSACGMAAGVTTLTLSPAGFTLEDRIASLRAGSDALERAGLA